MTEEQFIEKRKQWPHRCKEGICAYCGYVQKYGETFRGLKWKYVDKTMSKAAKKFSASHFGYVCENCYTNLTGRNVIGVSLADQLFELNEKRKLEEQ